MQYIITPDAQTQPLRQLECAIALDAQHDPVSRHARHDALDGVVLGICCRLAHGGTLLGRAARSLLRAGAGAVRLEAGGVAGAAQAEAEQVELEL